MKLGDKVFIVRLEFDELSPWYRSRVFFHISDQLPILYAIFWPSRPKNSPLLVKISSALYQGPISPATQPIHTRQL